MRAPLAQLQQSPPMSGRVAVIIAAYNAQATLDRAVASALAQPETAEVCIVDDGSRDGTLARALAWAERDPRVIARSQDNAGPAAARNAAIAATTAPWIAVLDADDYMLDGRFTRMLAFGGEADFIADALIRVTEERPDAHPPTAPFDPAPLSFAAFVRGNMSAATGALDLGFLKPLMRRAFLQTHDLGYNSTVRLGEDYDLYCRALLKGAEFLVGGAAGYVSVDRAGSISNDHSAEDLRRMRDCDMSFEQIRPLSHEERKALRRHWARVDCRLQWRVLIDAVKRRDARAAVSTFHSPPAAAYLAGKLGEQLWLRGPVRLWFTIASALGHGSEINVA